MAELKFGDLSVKENELESQIRKTVAGFVSLGIERGHSVALLLRNDVAFLQATLALKRIGAYPVPINWHSTIEEARYIINDSSSRLIVIHEDFLTTVMRDAISDIPILAVELSNALIAAFPNVARNNLKSTDILWTSWLTRQAEDDRQNARLSESIIYTSGTTGRPKGVKRAPLAAEHVSAIEHIRRNMFGVNSNSRALLSAPLYHTAPLMFAQQAVKDGAALIVHPRFDPTIVLQSVCRDRITTLYAVPTMFSRLLALPFTERSSFDLSSLSFILHAGSPCPPTLKREMIEWLGPIIYEYYGSTEHGPLTFVTSEEWLEHPGTVGRPLDGVEIKIYNDHGALSRANEPGEIFAANHFYSDFTYVNRSEERVALQHGSLVATGDIGFFNQSGYLFICDRKRDMIISGGVNVYPAEIEAVIMSNPDVADCAVFGIPHDDFGETVAAFIEIRPRSSLTTEEIRNFIEKHIAGFKQPRYIQLRESLPREENGKIKKRLLREPFWANRPRPI